MCIADFPVRFYFFRKFPLGDHLRIQEKTKSSERVFPTVEAVIEIYPVLLLLIILDLYESNETLRRS